MPKEFIINAEKSFIGSWFIDDQNLCDRLIDFFETSQSKSPGKYKSKEGLVVDKSIKDSLDLRLDPSDEIAREYAMQLQSVLAEYVKRYSYCNDTAYWMIESIQIQKYEPNGAYFKWHFERASATPPNAFRHLVFMTYLNDVTEGGETEFYYQEAKVSPKKGLTLIWPVDWTHTHRGLPSPTEAKYIITGWYIFVDSI